MAVLKYYDETKQKYLTLPLGTESVAVYDNGYAYSEDEQIVGCWVDGRPIYSKTIQCSAPSSANSTTVICVVSNICSNIDIVVSLDGRMTKSGENSMPINFNQANTYWSITMFTPSMGIRQNISAHYINYTNTITVEYTKTTDAENSFTLDMLSVGSLDTEATEEEVAAVLGIS